LGAERLLDRRSAMNSRNLIALAILSACAAGQRRTTSTVCPGRPAEAVRINPPLNAPADEEEAA